VCVCNLSYPARKAHAPYHIVRGLFVSNIFPQHDFREKVTGYNMCLVFSTNFASKEDQQDVITKYPLFLSDINEA
jgi:hypothetical protein